MRAASTVNVLVIVLAIIALANAQCVQPKWSAIVEGKGIGVAKLTPSFNYFTRLLGGNNNGSDGPKPSGHRSINWDADAVPFRMPGNFFKNTVTRGLQVTVPDNKFRVSNPPDFWDNKFNSINPQAARDFTTFSPKRLFTPLNYNKFTITFFVPQRARRALVKGFGAIYVDVDVPRGTKAVYYDRNGCVLKTVWPEKQNKGLTFTGVVFDRPIIARVVITLGKRAINTPWTGGDVVVLDDFLYGEPRGY